MASALASPDACAEFNLAECSAVFKVKNLRAAMVAHEEMNEYDNQPLFRQISSGAIMSAGRYIFEMLVFWGIHEDGQPDMDKRVGWGVRRLDRTEDSCILGGRIQIVNTVEERSFAGSIHKFNHLKIGQVWGALPWKGGRGLLLSDILDSSNGWLHGGDLVIRARAQVVIAGDEEKAHACDAIEDLPALSLHFKELLKGKNFADCTISAGDLKIEAHRCVLAARSPVFAAMLSAGMQESHGKSVIIDDLCPCAVQNMITYLYTGSVRLPSSDGDDACLQLLRAAHRYQVDGLVQTCANIIGKQLTVDNACEKLKFADLLNCKSLKIKCLDFIADHIAEVQNSSGYAELGRPQLVMDIVARLHPPMKRQRTDEKTSSSPS